jgi:deoxyadenosine/deoxycytidine kinase
MQQQIPTSTKPPLFVAIEGCIGVGKTTLTKALAKRFGGLEMLELVEENPFLAEFYKDPALLAFKTQIFFLLSRYRQQQGLSQINLFEKSIVSDYFIAKDRIFAELTLKESEFQLYEQLYQALCHQIHSPNLIIYLRAPLDVVLGRIEKRGRSFEKDIDPNYLENLMHAYDRYFADFKDCPVLTVETEDLNFPEYEEHITYVIDAVGETLNQKKSSHLIKAGEIKQQTLFS